MKKSQYDDFEFDDIGKIMKTINPIAVQNDMNQAIYHAHPHYSDMRFKEPQTVFLLKGYKKDKQGYVKGTVYNYSDRIWQSDWEKARASSEAAKEQVGNINTAAYFEKFLQLYFDKPHLKLVHIIGGVNQWNGYDYLVFGYFPEGE